MCSLYLTALILSHQSAAGLALEELEVDGFAAPPAALHGGPRPARWSPNEHTPNGAGPTQRQRPPAPDRGAGTGGLELPLSIGRGAASRVTTS